MTTPLTILALAGASGALAAVLAWLGVGATALSGPIKDPALRLQDHAPTPQGGGVGLALGVGGALAGYVWLRPAGLGGEAQLAGLAGVTAFGALIGAVGLADDLLELGPRLKFFVLGGASVGLAAVGGPVELLPIAGAVGLATPGVAGLLGAALWAFTAVNAVNFMDGINGLVGGAIAIAGVALALLAALAGAPEAAALAGALAGAALGFLFWNARDRAAVFMGDSGALFFGALYAGAALLYIRAAPPGAVYIAPLLVLPMLSDVLMTLAWRAGRGRALLRPHRDHAYQRRVGAGARHLSSSAVVWAESAGCAAAALVWAVLPWPAGLAPMAGALTLILAGLALAWRWRRQPRGD